MSWNVTLISAKFLGRTGGTTANAIKAVDYVTDLKTRHGLEIVATNNSWGGGGFSQALLDAIDRGGDADILFIAAAGNGGRDGVGDNNDVTPNYPRRTGACAAAPGLRRRRRRPHRHRGEGQLLELRGDVRGPGCAGLGRVLDAPGKNGTSSYGAYSGTSMATPHVTGAGPTPRRDPNATASEIRAALLGDAAPTPSLDGRTTTKGRLNASSF